MWDVPRAPPVILGPGNEQGFGGPVTAGPAPARAERLLGAPGAACGRVSRQLPHPHPKVT